MLKKIDGALLKQMLVSGSNRLNENREYVDSLNVFPVPDGDTGTNMSHTVIAAAREAEKINSNDAHEVARAAASGSLRGARGNSGVILSQLFRGFARGLEEYEEITTEAVAVGFSKASETAYKAVMKPKEGTILTIARLIADKANELAIYIDDIEMFLTELITYGHEELKKTKQMLPELRQANVVDAGGMGLLFILEGAFAGISGSAELDLDLSKTEGTAEPRIFSEGDIHFQYCTEFFVLTKNSEDGSGFMEELEKIGDSIVLVSDDSCIKVHVHTNNPGVVLEMALKLGELSGVKIDNMREQHNSILNLEDAPPKEMGFVVTSIGEGFDEIFTGLGADRIIQGGQTMNPSTEAILSAIEKVNAEHVFVLPNNKNIILAAKQAASLCKKNVHVLETTSIPQGITALVNSTPTMSLEENIENMNNAISQIKTGQVTFAVRDSILDEQEIKEGNYIYMMNGHFVAVNEELEAGTKALIDSLLEDGGDVMCIYSGQDAQQEITAALESYVNENYPDIELEIYEGGQPLYFYIISVE